MKVKRESKTLATITFQNFFNKYDKKGGMTGTALTEEKEFRDIYGMDVVEIPTNRVVQRKDLDDAVYMTKKEKFNAVVEAVKEAHAKHQPVLVGTITIETSELLSRMLKREGIPHNVLNAKFHELEAEIVAQAGQADALIAGATIKQERIDSGWIFSDGYYNATQTFVVSEDSDIASYEDLKGKNVAVKKGTAGADFANSLKDEYGFTVTVFEDSPTMYQDVILGNSAACVEDTPIMAASIKEGNLALKIPEGMESDGAPYGLAIMDEKNQELLDMFNKGLEDIKANGTYDEIIAKYLGE